MPWKSCWLRSWHRRKVAFGAAAGLAATAGLASALAPSFIWLVILRLLVGCGLVGVLPMYTLLEEWLPRDSGGKGKWLVALQVWWSIGTVLEGLLALWLLNAYGWRVLLAASSVPLACILAALPWVPESPHYLAATGRLLESRGVLVAAAKRNGTAARLEQHLQLQATDFTAELPPERGLQRHQVQQIAVEDAEANPAADSEAAAMAMRDSNGGQGLGYEQSSTTELRWEVAADSFSGQSPSIAVRGGCGELCCGNSDEANGGSDGGGSVGRSCIGRLGFCWRCRGREAAAVAATASSALGWCRELGALGRILLGPELFGRTWRLAITWFACALSYYGVAILVPYVAAGSLRERDGHGGAAAADRSPGGEGTGSCAPWPGGNGLHLVLPSSAYVSMMAAALAELPSMAWAFLTVDRWNRRNVVAFSLAVTAAALAPIVMAQASAERMPMTMPPLQPHLPAAAADSHTTSLGPFVSMRRRRLYPGWLTSPSLWWLPLASVLLGRLFVSGAFTLLYVLTPEQYPPRIHGSALGAANTLARLGALVAPFVAVALPQHGQLPMALGLMAAACCVAALAVGSLRGGTPSGA
ncbi:hypothetical protein VaNZ11_012101 [Volvox africanus]|uniref:Major facilitator superfamily (MFS) profile domain-containing protein n=1 Tax=Volvox africanus TaxID=51714 RepID=A0ABQ5SE44_9CHLO|nr:hypothetical protein VaNZ11_012101 [Volvox africanus]